MSEKDERAEVAKRRVVYALPGMKDVIVRRGVRYAEADGSALTFDVYAPPASGGARRPAVLFVSGFPDPSGRLKAMPVFESWAELVAVSGMIAVQYTNAAPLRDATAMLAHLRSNAGELGIDERRIGVWACSGHVPTALALLAREGNALSCAVLCYGFMFDAESSRVVRDASAQFGFADAASGKSVADLAADVPLLVIRAGQDQIAGVNATIDDFVPRALARSLPLTFVNHATGPHAFDMMDDTDVSRDLVRQQLAFLAFHLGPHT